MSRKPIMSRKPSDKPWLHANSGYWCATVNGKREYLDKDYKLACRKLRASRARQNRQEAGDRDWLEAPFAQLADEYLADVQARRKALTYESCRYRLLRALKVLGCKLPVAGIRKLHLATIERELTGYYSPTTIKDTIAAVQGVFNWAVKHDVLESNPLLGYEKPAARCRNRIINPAEFQTLLRFADPNFRRVLLTLRLTGCRPVEVRTLIWEWVDLETWLWIFPDHKTVTQQRQPRPRIVALPEPILNLCHWLARKPHAPSDHVFLNKHGRAYTKDCLVRKMDRIRKRAGITSKGGEQIVLYSNRHTFGTQAAGKITDIELAELMGHTTTHTTKRYVHLNADRLRDIQRRAQG